MLCSALYSVLSDLPGPCLLSGHGGLGSDIWSPPTSPGGIQTLADFIQRTALLKTGQSAAKLESTTSVFLKSSILICQVQGTRIIV